MTSFTFRTAAMVIASVSMLITSPTILNSSVGQESKTPAFKPLGQTQNEVAVSIVAKKDDRAEKLRRFLASKNSPMTGSAKALVKIADKYKLDWTFLPAIAGLESQYGKFIPAGSYNPYGWNNGKMGFKSWADASETVAAGIRSRYQATGAVTAAAIGSRYAASPTWATRVTFNQKLILGY